MKIRKTVPIITLLLLISLFGCANKNDDSTNVSSNEYVEQTKEPSGQSDGEIGLEEESAQSEAENSTEGASGQAGSKSEEPPKHIKLSVTESGNDVFIPNSNMSHDYRYGPSILLEDDGGIDAWFSSPGDGDLEFDWITYRHSDDGGATWSDEKVVLSPTPNSMDALSVCDPDVFFHDGYYYLGYTSTIDETNNGLCNSVFLARSENPDGPFEKWNGSGWGGMPKPIIYYDGVSIGWGIGEPSFVVVGDTLFVYTTKDSYSGGYARIKMTEVRTADISGENWQSRLEYQGCAVVRTDSDGTDGYAYSDCDSWDVAYVEENDMFVALCTNRRFTDDSCLLYYESPDGLNFERVSELNTNVICGCHNCGLMGDKNAHIKSGDKLLAGYAYSGSDNSEWGVWATRFAPLSLELVEEREEGEDGLSNLKLPIKYRSRAKNTWNITVGADELTSRRVYGSGSFNLSCYRINSNYDKYHIDASEIILSGYNNRIVSVEGSRLTPLSPGVTPITMEYRGLSRELCICVLPDRQVQANGIYRLFSAVTRYEFSMSQPYAVAIRPLVQLNNYYLGELNSDEISSYALKFEVEDESICTVRDDAVIAPVSPGDTVIRVYNSAGLSYRVAVRITE